MASEQTPLEMLGARLRTKSQKPTDASPFVQEPTDLQKKCGHGELDFCGITFSIGDSLERRLETLAAVSFSLYIFVPVLLLCLWSSLLYLIFPLSTIPMLLYLAAIYWSSSPETGERSPWLRSITWWQRFANFFPVTLVKTAPLPPHGRYLIGYHPHGIISVGAFTAFCTEGARTMDISQSDDSSSLRGSERGWEAIFPGVDRRLVTLPLNFCVPFLREYFLSLGLLSSSRNTFRNVLSENGNALAVVVGGADEAQLSQPHTMRLVLRKRKGFVREALISGASLVPTVAFGENDLYTVMSFPSGHIIQRIQTFVLGKFGFSLPLFRGRSIFCHDFGLLPTRHPINIVLGAPIPVPAVDAASFKPKWDTADNPLNEDAEVVDRMHARYLDELRVLAKKYKTASWNGPGQAMLERQESLTFEK